MLASDGTRDGIYSDSTRDGIDFGKTGKSKSRVLGPAVSSSFIDLTTLAPSVSSSSVEWTALDLTVDEVFSRDPSPDIVARGFNIEITVAMIQRLNGRRKLNDEIINFYFGMIAQRSAKKNKKVFAFTTYFMAKLYLDNDQYEYAAVSSWSKNFNPFELDKLFIPIHLPNHWTFIIVYFETKVINYCDSMHGDGKPYTQVILRWLGDEFRIRQPEIPFNGAEWQTKDIRESPSQSGNGTCCGVFAVMSADYLSNDIPLSASIFGLGDIPNFRRDIARDILRGYLDDPSELLGNDDQGTSICLLYI